MNSRKTKQLVRETLKGLQYQFTVHRNEASLYFQDASQYWEALIRVQEKGLNIEAESVDSLYIFISH